MNLSKPQRVAAMSSAGTLLAGVGAAVGTADWRLGLYGLLVSVLAGVSGALWPSKPAQPLVTTMTGPSYLDPTVKAGADLAARAARYAAQESNVPWTPAKPDDEPPTAPTPVG